MHKKSKSSNSFRITSSIIDDHINAEKLMDEYHLLKQNNLEAAKKLFFKMKEELLKHMSKEEENLFPLFESRSAFLGSDPMSTLRKEHKEIRSRLIALEKLLLRPKAKKDARQEKKMENELVKFLRAHEAKEEEVFYPWLDKIIPEEKKKTAVAQMGNSARIGPTV